VDEKNTHKVSLTRIVWQKKGNNLAHGREELLAHGLELMANSRREERVANG
jgi:hypothetical protein